jgi:hypothetical protein
MNESSSEVKSVILLGTNFVVFFGDPKIGKEFRKNVLS